MSLLVIGLSHHTAPLGVLEALSERPDRAEAIASSVLGSATATETVVLSTCNRLEVYASVPAFHPAVAAIGEALALAAGLEEPDGLRERAELSPGDPADALAARAEALADHLYVRHDDAAVAHAFTVACGLDSMAVGEAQVLGQMRDALAGAQDRGQVGETSTRSSSRPCGSASAPTPTPTSTSTASRSCRSRSRRRRRCSARSSTSRPRWWGRWHERSRAATTAGAGVGSLTIVNRTPERAERLAAATSRHRPALG